MYMKEIGKMISSKDMVRTTMLTDQLIEEIGKMIYSMALEQRYQQVVDTLMKGKNFKYLVIINKGKKMGMGK